MIAFLISPIGRYIGLALALCALAWGVVIIIERNGAQKAISAMKDTTIETLRKRAKVNDETNTASDPALCIALGGVFNHAENKCM